MLTFGVEEGHRKLWLTNQPFKLEKISTKLGVNLYRSNFSIYTTEAKNPNLYHRMVN